MPKTQKVRDNQSLSKGKMYAAFENMASCSKGPYFMILFLTAGYIAVPALSRDITLRIDSRHGKCHERRERCLCTILELG